MLCLIVVVIPVTITTLIVVAIMIAAGGFGEKEGYAAIAFGSLIVVAASFILVSIVRHVCAKQKAGDVNLEKTLLIPH